MKRLMKVLLSLMIPALLLNSSGCRGVGINNFMFSDEIMNPNECWISTDPPIYFGWSTENSGYVGEVTLSDGSTIPIWVDFNYGSGIGVFRLDDIGAEEAISDVVFGQCKWSKSKIVVTVTKDSENWLNGAKTITFVRQDKETAIPP